MQRIVDFNDLGNADLIVDALYRGGTAKNAGDDPISKLIKGCGNQAGFRYIGSSSNLSCKLVVLYSSLANVDWPDAIDVETGQFTYYGDNKSPGHQLHETPRKGNVILRDAFDAVHNNNRLRVPPFFIFTKGAVGRDVIFKGIAVPGGVGLSPTEDLVAVWKSKEGHRFQNYRSIFTILDIPIIAREWLSDIISGNVLSNNCPNNIKKWYREDIYMPLRAERTIEYRSKQEQLPNSESDTSIIKVIYSHFSDSPYEFERCAAELTKLMDSRFVSYDLTRPWLDGGRDAIGQYRLGYAESSVHVEYALEAKCYALNNAVGIRETSRLISRLKYRQFGVLVTTSYVHLQAYKEIIEDRHPVIILSSQDIVKILRSAGYGSASSVRAWLNANFPIN